MMTLGIGRTNAQAPILEGQNSSFDDEDTGHAAAAFAAVKRAIVGVAPRFSEAMAKRLSGVQRRRRKAPSIVRGDLVCPFFVGPNDRGARFDAQFFGFELEVGHRDVCHQRPSLLAWGLLHWHGGGRHADHQHQ